MSYVCLWSPAWPTGAAFDAELVPALLAHAPRVVIGDEGRLWADARGLHASMLAEQLLDVVRVCGVPEARAGTAVTPIAAETAATWVQSHGEIVATCVESGCAIVRQCDGAWGLGPGAWGNDQLHGVLTVVQPGQDREFIAGFPVGILRPEPFLASLLDGVGIDTCGRLAALDAEAVEVRLGGDGVRLWDLARGNDDRWLFRTPLRSLPSASLEWMEYALRDAERLVFVINSLLTSVCAALVAQGERARELTLIFSLANRHQLSHTLRSARPTADHPRWLRQVRDALEQLRLPDAVMGITLRVDTVTGNDGAQGDLFDRGFASAGAVETMLAALADDQDELVVAPRNSEHPLLERRTQWVAEEPTAVAERSYALRARDAVAPHVPQLTLQLLAEPRAIAVDTRPRRDHEVPIRYRDQEGWHSLVDVAGPDRVSGGQWESAYAREYFRCVRDDGMLVWMYRGRGEGQENPRWYLHGWWD